MAEESQRKIRVTLLLGAQRALWGNVPTTLRSVSVSAAESVIHFRCYFDAGASDNDRELLSDAAGELLADFRSPWHISEEFIELAAPAPMAHLEHLVFLRHESATPTI
jgi:hypothetical protein